MFITFSACQPAYEVVKASGQEAMASNFAVAAQADQNFLLKVFDIFFSFFSFLDDFTDYLKA